MKAFDLYGPLPSGTTVLEASAGTGKTYTIAALAVRMLAEGRNTIGEMLIVTFSRAATAELRWRVRERVRSSAEALVGALAGVRPEDQLDQWLAQAERAELELRARRLEAAFADFDQATIMTTHEFSHAMIRGLGVLAPQEPLSTMVEDLGPLADEAAADLYLARYAFDGRYPPFGFFDDGWKKTDDPGARTLARDVVRKQGRLEPAASSGRAGERVRFAEAVRDEVNHRKRRRRLYSFPDQLSRLDSALTDPVTGEMARAKLARRFPVVLVDEFQDTDPVQWRILKTAFGGGAGSTLVLIGDPKQAIYRFRGADVHAYSAAVNQSASVTTLATNYRSDKVVVDAVSALFKGVSLGRKISNPQVSAYQVAPRLVSDGFPWSAGLQIRCLDSTKTLFDPDANRSITKDLVNVVSALLAPGSPLRNPGGPLKANDIAILVRSNKRGLAISRALTNVGIPCAFSGTSSVFASDAASDWQTLLTALESPQRHLQRAVVTRFLGGTVTQLATASDDDMASWSLKLHTWARTLRLHGLPALEAQINADTGFTTRLLRQPSGERLVTDYRHVAELLHQQFSKPATQLADGIAWLATAIADASNEERTQRLETDADAVAIMTIHRAKGRQFPVVLLPETTSSFDGSEDSGATLDLPLPGDRLLDVGGREHAQRPKHWASTRSEDADESLRTFYVGLTRAQSHAITWWANTKNTPPSALNRLLNTSHGEVPATPDPSYPPLSPLKMGWLKDAGIATVAATTQSHRRQPPPEEVREPLRARAWVRSIDQTWRRTSYSGLTAGLHDQAPLNDEPEAQTQADPRPELSRPSPMAHLPSGTTFGTVVHHILEHVDPTAPAWREALLAESEAALRRWALKDTTAPELAEALEHVFQTPLGPLAGNAPLCEFGRANRLTELDFEFAMDAPGTLASVAQALRPHVAGTPLAGYPSRLERPELASQSLRGFLTGSIDAVLRLPNGSHLVVDYKTNRLSGPDDGELTIGHYTPSALAQAMMDSHYPLQALLYSVALHRFLSHRLAGYDPDVHLGGVAYLFVRGMTGADTPVVGGSPLGVFSWRPPAEAIMGISSLLSGGRGQ